MAMTDIIHLQAIRSKDILSGSSANLDVARHFDGETSPKLPTAEQLEYGDIALNIAPGYEVISIKNYNGEIVYLPFNLGDRVLSLEGIQKYVVDNFQALSGDIITFNELFNNEIKEQLNAFSSVTQTTVDALLDSTYGQLRNDIDEYALTHAAALAQFNTTLGLDSHGKYNFSVEYLSGRTITNAIEAVDERIDEIEDLIELNQIRLSGDVSSKNDLLINLINNLSNHVEESNSEIYRILDEKVSSLSAVTKGNFEETVSALTETIETVRDSLSAKTDVLSSTINENKSGLTESIKSVASELNEKIDSVSGDIESKYDSEIESINNRLESLSGITQDSISNEVSLAAEQLSGQINEGDLVRAAAIAKLNQTIGLDVHGNYDFAKDYLSGRTLANAIEAVDDRMDEIETNQELLEARTNRSIDSLNNDLKEQQASLTELIDKTQKETLEYVDNLSAVTSSKFDDVVESINDSINTVKGDIDQLSGSVNDINDTLTSQIISNVSGLSKTIESVSGEISTKFDTKIQNITDILSEVSASTPDMIVSEVEKEVSDAVNQINEALSESDIVRAASIARLNTSIGFNEHGNADFYSDYLSGRTLVDAIEAVDLKVDDEVINLNRRMYDLSSSTQSVYDKYDDVEQSINQLSGNVNDIVEQIYTDLDSSVSSLTNTFNDKISDSESSVTEYINTIASGLSSNIESISGQIGDNISVQVDNLRNDFDSFSAKTSIQYDEFTSGVTEQLSTVDDKITSAVTEVDNEFSEKFQNVVDRLSNDELVHAAAYAKLNSQFGFDRNGNYVSDFEILSGRTIAGAIDYLAEAWDDNDWKIDRTYKSISEYDEILAKYIEESNLKHNELEQKIGVGVDALSAETHEEIAVLEKNINDKISSLSAASTTDLEKSVSSITAYVADLYDDLSNEISLSKTNEEVLSGKTDILSSVTEQLSADVESTIERVEGITSSLTEDVNSLSSGLTVTNENVDSLRQELYDTEMVRAAAVSRINASLGFDVHGNYVPYSEELSGRTISDAIEYLNAQAEEDRYDSEVKYENANRSLQEHIEAVDDRFVEFTQNLADLSEVVNNGHIEIINQHTKDIEALSGEVNNRAVVLQDDFNKTLDGTKEEINSNISQFKDEVKVDFDTFSATTIEYVNTFDGRIIALSGNIEDAKDELHSDIDNLDEKIQAEFIEVSATTDSIQDNLANDEVVHASAFAKMKNAIGLSEQVKFSPYSTELQGRDMTGAMDYLLDYIQELEQNLVSLSGRVEDVKTLHMKEVTYETLLRLTRREQLEWGQYYKITNYQATVNDSLRNSVTTRLTVKDSEAHTNSGFYIIVKATGSGTLSEHAWAMQVDVDEEANYFERNAVEAWDIKYDLYNETARFNWANPKGFGVIYYMKDEFGNEANYDFKNIMFYVDGKKQFTFTNKTNNFDLSLTNKANNNLIRGAYSSDGAMMLNFITTKCNKISGNEFVGGCQEININTSNFNSCIVGTLINGNKITSDKQNQILGFVGHALSMNVKNKNLTIG